MAGILRLLMVTSLHPLGRMILRKRPPPPGPTKSLKLPPHPHLQLQSQVQLRQQLPARKPATGLVCSQSLLPNPHPPSPPLFLNKHPPHQPLHRLLMTPRPQIPSSLLLSCLKLWKMAPLNSHRRLTRKAQPTLPLHKTSLRRRTSNNCLMNRTRQLLRLPPALLPVPKILLLSMKRLRLQCVPCQAIMQQPSRPQAVLVALHPLSEKSWSNRRR